MEYIKDHTNKIIGTSYTNGSKTIVRDFKTGNIVSSYDANSDKTTDWKNNKSLHGNQANRFVK